MKTVPVVPLAVILALVALELVYVKRVHPAELTDAALAAAAEEGVFNLEGAAFVNGSQLLVSRSDDDVAGFVLLEKDSLLNSSQPISNVEPLRNGLLSYRVEEGDSLSTIAAEFGISVNTIIWANDIGDSSLIQPGEEIVVLPVSGVLHEVGEGETLESIAVKYGVETNEIAAMNRENIRPGDQVVVPNAKPKTVSPAYASRASSLPDASGYFIRPISGGWNWGRLHDGNAVDISDACGRPIFAAADGLVVSVGSPLLWNGGYGGYVRVEHPNGTRTLYAHNSENLVSVGETVSQGGVIARIGRTGSVSGTTGCHVHFGVSGAQNPFVN